MIPQIQEINFPAYATLHEATISLGEMGDRTISTQVRIDGDIVPDFDGWELEFRGERFILPIKEPQAAKDNTTRNSLIDLTFHSWAVHEMKRYFFVELTSINSGTAIADKYKASVRMNLRNFAALFNQVLDYYFDGQIVMDLFMPETYSTEPVEMQIDYTYIWDVLTKFYEVYGVRWNIVYDSTGERYVIRVGYDPGTLSDHDFEYGYKGGLLRFERQVQNDDIFNILLGRGGTKNLPYRYFKKIDEGNPEWSADPDAIPELANIYFEQLRDINFRWYVRGWMTNSHRDRTWENAGYVYPSYPNVPQEYLFAYQMGATDEKFNPVEYVKDDESIAKYGERWGAAEDNADIFPTIQGMVVGDYGRIDEVVAVSEIVSDDIDAATQGDAVETNLSGEQTITADVPGHSSLTRDIRGGNFTVPDGQIGRISYSWLITGAPARNGSRQGGASASTVRLDTSNSSILVYDVSTGTQVPSTAIPAGTYYYSIHISVANSAPATIPITFGVSSIFLTTASAENDAWKPTFDIWVKNIWDTHKREDETDEDYAYRVWRPILGDRLGNEAKVVFSSGFLSISEDYEFTIASYPVYDTSKSINGVPSEWRITLRKSDAEFDVTGLYIPNATTGGNAVAGDYFFFTGIDMPWQYVIWAEEKLNAYKATKLGEMSDIAPTWVISLDKVRVNTIEDDDYETKLINRLATGVKIRIKDKRFTRGDILTLYVQSITYTWREPSQGNPYLVPDVEVVLSDKIVSRESPLTAVQNEVQSIKAQYAQISDVESIVKQVAGQIFLKKTGESDTSSSPTTFSSKISSRNFRQGDIGGRGWGLYEDNGAAYKVSTTSLLDSPSTPSVAAESETTSVFEVDKLIVRKEMHVNSIVANQIEFRGGKEVLSAAKIECTQVVETNDDYICYFDQKQGSVENLFVVGDIAMGQVFRPNNVQLRYYRRRVDAVDTNSISLSKTVYDGSGIPEVGDVIVQYGHESILERQYVIIRDVIGGGYERMLSGLSSVVSSGNEYYFAGMTGDDTERWDDDNIWDDDDIWRDRVYARWFVGDKNYDYAEYKNSELKIKAKLSILSQVEQSDGTYIALSTFLHDLSYLEEALNEATIISGGLILTSAILLGQTVNDQFSVYSGINGNMSSSNIAAWYGGPMVDHEASPSASDYAKSLFRFDGSGYLAGGNIYWNSQGYGHIPGVSWSSSGIVLDSGVYISGGNQQISSLVNAVNAVMGWFEVVNGNLHVKSGMGLYSDSFISAGGLSPGGGGGGSVTLSANGDNTYALTVGATTASALATKDYVDNAIASGGGVSASLTANSTYSGTYNLTVDNTTATALITQAYLAAQNYLTGITGAMVGAALGYTAANDANVVHLAGTETITGAKTFTGALDMTYNYSNFPGHFYHNLFANDRVVYEHFYPNGTTSSNAATTAHLRVWNGTGITALTLNGSTGALSWNGTDGGTFTRIYLGTSANNSHYIEYANGAFHVVGNLYADGYVSAGGQSSGGGGGSISVDTALSSTSTNPVQNKVIYAAIGNVESLLAAI